MKSILTQLSLAAAFALPLAAGAAPAIKITSPVKAPTTNGVLNAAGTAKSTAPIAAVYYSFNGSDWAVANGTTNWSVAGLMLKPGSNVFSAYAVDGAAASPTNKVIFTYVVNVPVTVLTNGPGMVSPNYSGKLLQIGKAYKMAAKAAKGFGFTGWTGDAATNAAKLTFVMASNLTFIANFADITRPVCIITFPAVKQSVSNSPITVTGRASDNVGVSTVNFQFNGGGWNSATLDADGTNWLASNVTLTPGTNTLRAFAVDAAGNVSLTNSVAFTYLVGPVTGPAPASLSGLVGEVQIEGEAPFEISFGMSTFGNSDVNSGGVEVGNYTYTLLSSNTAQFVTTAVLPPTVAGDMGGPLLTFTNDSTAVFTNSDGSNGVITFSAAANLVPSLSAIITVQAVDSDGNTNVTLFGEGVFTNFDGGGNVTGSGTYSFQQFSPVAAMLQWTYTDDVNTGAVSYAQLTFSATNAGSFFTTSFDASGDPPDLLAGSFTILSVSNPPAGHAPMSIAGETATITPNGSSAFHACFGAGTYSQSASDTNHFNGVGDYTYMKTGANTAQLFLTELEPPGNTSPILLYLTFSSSSSSTFAVTNSDGVHTGSFSFAAASSFAPASLSGKTLKVVFNGFNGTVVLNADGTFTLTSSSGTNDSGNYTYAQNSPTGGMLVLYYTAGSDTGKTTYAGLTFNTSNGGNILITTFDNLGNFDDVHSGTFKLQ